MNAHLRNDITAYHHLDDENPHTTWERYKSLLRCCPMHDIQPETQIEIFYNGLNSHIRNLVDASANGPLLDCTYNDAMRARERIAQNDYQYPISRVVQAKTTPGVIELDAITALSAQVFSLTNMIKNM